MSLSENAKIWNLICPVIKSVLKDNGAVFAWHGFEPAAKGSVLVDMDFDKLVAYAKADDMDGLKRYVTIVTKESLGG